MFAWLQFFGEFLYSAVESIQYVVGVFADSLVVFRTSFLSAPTFLTPLLYLGLAAAIVMWVVNIF